MELRQMATVFLFYDNHVLIMKKTSSRLYQHEFYSGLGGHLEPSELNDPKSACFREVQEESGIPEQNIHDLKLRYVLLRVKDGEIRQQFVYFGRTSDRQCVPSEEGELLWVEEAELLKLRTSQIIHFMLQHYFAHRQSEEVMVGTIALNDEQKPIMQWARMQDPIIF
ncbi:NUDIX domain-containing protein [Paenibacillus sp. CF384]|uniref:NUDIX domain-containing protein n=1 Tax=Paenibacillus sp. CF384 TaxID=1884382 RepID=UPI0008973C0B|nr:NUDIX domain-containing protein [Paenibacillus sp. CF384]SDW23751.1 8-oxo-dGTP diphosphatase [Paenibacillus sp. CF384]